MSVLNRLINSLPFEAHIPGYQFCGPGTNLKKRLARNDQGVNKLDQSCRVHDIAYNQNTSLDSRHKADRELMERAWERVKAKDSSIGEKVAAWGVTNAMKAKVKLGMGVSRKASKKAKRPQKSFKQLVKNIKKAVTLSSPLTGSEAISVALKAANQFKNAGIKPPKAIPIQKSGGFLPLIPILAALSAVGALSGGAAQIAKAVNSAQIARKELQEANRHNKTMEAIAIGKGLYLAPYKKGTGLFLKPYKSGGSLKRCNKQKN